MFIEFIRITSKFEKQYKKLPKKIREIARRRECVFRNNAFDGRLKTHLLKGKEKSVWSFSVTHHHRVKFIFLNNRTVLFIEIGGHEIYK